MSKTTTKKILNALLIEREAALRGDFEGLNQIAKTKESEFLKLRSIRLSDTDLIIISKEVSRNQAIMNAVISGVKSARSHIIGSKNDASKVTIYNKSGAMETFDNRPALNSEKY
ncbi:hypothetical protein FHS72_001923 [Loktanella ponticola]|uniref:Flagellar protein FlgN n=1 Tax=Yoonia ponticola TaxID=1524255 RepID=A0A7W9BL35_9RHOB|nr:hypothetical protein [Yoonia ponticola]MBB5722297.1 hypothetical protein [Yoonia ponticola]